jgi:ribosomal protein S18 acetylase RimI-like enzyme
MTITLSGLKINDYEDAFALWSRCDGIGLNDADEFEPMKSFLEKNPGLSFVVRVDERLVGTCLCGTDGRRGYLYHLAVDPQFRQRGIGKQLVERTLLELSNLGIKKCHIMVFGANVTGLAFWKGEGWILRPEIVLMSHNVSCEKQESPC